MRVEDPQRYGVITGRETGKGIMYVESTIEKPSKSESNLTLMPVHVFDQRIFDALENTTPGKIMKYN
jgi:dTDP-glucose pyrophosphorylase